MRKYKKIVSKRKLKREEKKLKRFYTDSSSSEVWDLDKNICFFLATRLKKYMEDAKEVEHAYRKDWEDFERHIDGLMKYCQEEEWDINPEAVYFGAVEALHWVADNLGSLWY